jgi:hypothetical protein
MKPSRIEDHILFTMQFLQMMDDFQTVEDECPACGHSSRSNAICLRDECDFMLFTEPGKIHPSVIPWVNARKEILE